MILKPVYAKPSSVFYPAKSAGFNGTNTALFKAQDVFTSTSPVASFAGWFKTSGGDGTNMQIFAAESTTFGGVNIIRDSNNKIVVTLSNSSGGAKLFSFSSVNTYTTSNGWINILVSWNTNLSAGNKISNLIINGVSDKTVVTDASVAFKVYTLGSAFAVGASNAATQYMNGAMAEVSFSGSQFVDFSLLSSIRLFLTATKRPQPNNTLTDIYLKGSGTGFNINSGNIGNFTTTGTLTTPSTTPST